MSGIQSQHGTSTEIMSVFQNTVFAPILKRRKEETKLEAGCLPHSHLCPAQFAPSALTQEISHCLCKGSVSQLLLWVNLVHANSSYGCAEVGLTECFCKMA